MRANLTKKCLKYLLFSSCIFITQLTIAKKTMDSPVAIDKERCAALQSQQINKQSNIQAALLVQACQGRSIQFNAKSSSNGKTVNSINRTFDGSELNLITTPETFPAITQAGSVIWGHGSTIVSVYTDTSGAPDSFSGISVSTNDGTTFDQLDPSPFDTVFATDSGSPAVAYDDNLSIWLALAITTDCGAQSIGLMSTTTPELTASWSAESCVHAGVADDRPMLWVDNNSGSPYYGRRYISYNDFDAFGSLKILSLDTGASVWNEVTVATATAIVGFIRNVNIAGDIDGTNGFVYIFAMDEAGGAGANPKNWVYRSQDGGVTWTGVQHGSNFPAAGAGLCAGSDYFYMVPPNWRHMGWGQGAVGPGGIVHYVYSREGQSPGDYADIFYVRSTNAGANWSSPTELNTDIDNSSEAPQWQPSISVTSQGLVLAAWYDRRNTTNGLDYQYFGRLSLDNGITWQQDQPISDVIIPQATQFDPMKDFCFAGDSNIHNTLSNDALVTWTDGRNALPDGDMVDQDQMDVYFKRVPLCPAITLVSDKLPNGALTVDYDQTLAGDGGTGPYTFSLSGLLPTGLILDENTGNISGPPAITGNFFFSIIATDSFGCQGTEDYGVIIDPDPVAACPVISIDPLVLLDGAQGAEEMQIISASDGTEPYVYVVTEGVLPEGVSLDPDTGELTGVPQESSSFNFDITATDANQCTGTRTYTQLIECPMITLLPETQLPDTAAGFSYLTNVFASGGTAPYKFKPQSSHLNGLFYAEGGTIYGVPESGGSRNTTIAVVDANGCTGSRGFRVDSTNCPDGALFCDDKVDVGGDPAIFTTTDVCGSGDTQWYGTKNCPSSNDISHTPSDHARWGLLTPDGIGGFTEDCASYATIASQNVLESMEFDVTNCNSGEVRLKFNYLISFDEDATFDRARFEVVADGGAPEVFADNGAGGPTCGGLASPGLNNLKLWSGWQHFELIKPATTTLQVNFIGETDNGMSNVGEGLFIDDVVLQCVCPDDFIMMPDVLPNARLETRYNTEITTEGGQPVVTFGTPPSSGPLPPGLSLDTGSGFIFGFATTPGIFSFRVEATDGNACQIFTDYNMLVSPARCNEISFTPGRLESGTEGMFYAVSPVTSGDTEPNQFIVSAGVLPPGLSLNTTTGTISGTPDTPGRYPFTISVIDSLFCDGIHDYNINISAAGCPAISILPSALPNPNPGFYNETILGDGGEGPYTFVITSGSLPPGLSLDSESGVLSGTPTIAGSFPFEITAEDINGCFGVQDLSLTITAENLDIIFKDGFEMIP